MRVAFVSIGNRPHAKYCAASFRKNVPGARIIQITDMVSPEAEGVDEVIRKHYEHNLMMFLIESFAELPVEDGLITTADDCLLVKPIADVIEKNADVALIERDNYDFVSDTKGLCKFKHKFPFSNGLVVTRKQEFYQDCKEILEGMWHLEHNGFTYWQWWGDMACISEVVQSGKYTVLGLPEQEYSYKPKYYGDTGTKEVVMLHYAGSKKHWMKTYPL